MVEDDLVDADTQTIDSPTQQIIDGKKFICSFLSFYNKYKPKNFLMLADTSTESPKPIQPNVEMILAHHRLFILLSQSPFQKMYCVPVTIHLIANPFAIFNKIPFVHM